MVERELSLEKRILFDAAGAWERVAWIAHGRRCSIEFHCAVYSEEIALRMRGILGAKNIDGRWLMPSGVEIHQRGPFEYGDQNTPNHTDCTILGGKCWHDGSSAASTEFFQYWGGSDEEAFDLVRGWLLRRDTEDPEPDTARAKLAAALAPPREGYDEEMGT